MKRINLFILLILAAVNTCGAMDVKTIDPVVTIAPVVVAATKLQAKPFVFFNTENLLCSMDYSDLQKTGKILRASDSIEMNDIEQKLYQIEKEFYAKVKAYQDEWNDVQSKFNKQQISMAAYNDACTNRNDQLKQLNDETNANRNKIGKQHTDVIQKITTIAMTIAKRMGACGILSYNSSQQQLGHQSILCIDPEYDITQEVFDTLNNEYNKNKPQQPVCNNSCCVHCPLQKH